MPRKPEFNREQAVDAALKLFWRRGYTATTLPELLQAMGIARSSFYATFSVQERLTILNFMSLVPLQLKYLSERRKCEHEAAKVFCI